MKVVINEKEYEYHSDFPTGWLFNSKHYFKCPVTIGTSRCFIKRFELDDPGDISGWELLIRLRSRNELNLPRTHDVAVVEENSKKVYYLIHEFVEGATLESLINQEREIDLKKLTDSLTDALASVHKYDFWFPDLCEKNIFGDSRQKYFLIDLDSCYPASTSPGHDMDVNMKYWALVYNFYRDIIGLRDLKVYDLPGIALNHLQVIFLILHLKLFSLNPGQEYMSDEAFDELPAVLDKLDPEFRNVFSRVLAEGVDLKSSETTAHKIRQLIIGKILPINQWPPVEEIIMEEPEAIEESETHEEHPVELPEIDLRDAAPPEDSVDEEVLDTKLAEEYNSSIDLIEKVLPSDDTREESKAASAVVIRNLKEKKRPGAIVWAIAVAGLIVLAVISWFIVKSPGGRSATVISNFYPKTAAERSSIVLTGKDIPISPGEVEVLFNQNKGRILFISSTLITVLVPPLTDVRGISSDSIRVNVSVVAKSDTIHLQLPLTVKKEQYDLFVVQRSKSAGFNCQTVSADSLLPHE